MNHGLNRLTGCAWGLLVALFLIAFAPSAHALGDKGYIWNPPNMTCEGDSTYAKGAYLDWYYIGNDLSSNQRSCCIYTVDRNGVKRRETCIAGAGQVRDTENCQPGYVRNKNGCQAECKAPKFNFPADSDNCAQKPQCGKSEEYHAGTNSCRQKSCPSGTYLNPISGVCESPPEGGTSSSSGSSGSTSGGNGGGSNGAGGGNGSSSSSSGGGGSSSGGSSTSGSSSGSGSTGSSGGGGSSSGSGSGGGSSGSTSTSGGSGSSGSGSGGSGSGGSSNGDAGGSTSSSSGSSGSTSSSNSSTGSGSSGSSGGSSSSGTSSGGGGSTSSGSGGSTTTTTTTSSGGSGGSTSTSTSNGAGGSTSGLGSSGASGSGSTSTSSSGDSSASSGSTSSTSSGSGGASGSGQPSGQPSGKPSGSPSGDPDGNDFCKKNPNLNICKNSSVTGRCDSVSCDGDAITCAILKTQQMRDCQDHDDNDPQVKYGKRLLNGDDPLRDRLPTVDNAREVDLSNIKVDAAGWGGGGSCLQDRQFSVMGKTVVIPLSKLCEYLIILRYAIMLIASIVSFRMVSGSILKEV